jgi:hypothetical protein
MVDGEGVGVDVGVGVAGRELLVARQSMSAGPALRRRLAPLDLFIQGNTPHPQHAQYHSQYA